MALLDFLKNKQKAKEAKNAGQPKKELKAETSAKDLTKKKSDKKEGDIISFKGTGAQAVFILKQPHITEKATQLSGNDKYIFKVYRGSNKIEIKKAIEKLYNTKVLDVNVMNVPGKKRRVGRTMGRQSGFKKAVVTLPKGQKIDILSQ